MPASHASLPACRSRSDGLLRRGQRQQRRAWPQLQAHHDGLSQVELPAQRRYCPADDRPLPDSPLTAVSRSLLQSPWLRPARADDRACH